MRRMMVWLLVLLFSLSASAEEAPFFPGIPHASHLDYRQYFATMVAQTGACTLAIAEEVYEPDLALRLYEQVAADEAILAGMSPPREHTIYVVKKAHGGHAAD